MEAMQPFTSLPGGLTSLTSNYDTQHIKTLFQKQTCLADYIRTQKFWNEISFRNKCIACSHRTTKQWVCFNASLFVAWTPLRSVVSVNRPFYSCLLSDLAFEWQRGWRWPCFDTDLTSFCCVNHDVLMLTSWYLHEKSREVCIKARSPPASLAFLARLPSTQL